MRVLGVVLVLVCLTGTAEARPELFAEGMVGLSFPLGTETYAEDRGGGVLHAGVRGGAWLWRGRGARARGDRRWGVELKIDRAEFASDYSYTRRWEDPPDTINTQVVEPAYLRLRALAGGRGRFELHPVAALELHVAAGFDRVTGSVEETAPVVDLGAQLSFTFGRLWAGIDWTFAMSFHDSQELLPLDQRPVNNRDYGPGFDRAVDLVGCVVVGAGF